ncbi:MAG: hypothetical protein EOO61_23125, partial [Hymenobacter sp.]
MKQTLLILLWMATYFSASAQSRTTLSGTVKDEQGATLPGISLVVKGTTTGTTTDANGNFQLNTTSRNATLVVSGVGYLKQEVAVGNATSLAIVMRED